MKRACARPKATARASTQKKSGPRQDQIFSYQVVVCRVYPRWKSTELPFPMECLSNEALECFCLSSIVHDGSHLQNFFFFPLCSESFSRWPYKSVCLVFFFLFLFVSLSLFCLCRPPFFFYVAAVDPLVFFFLCVWCHLSCRAGLLSLAEQKLWGLANVIFSDFVCMQKERRMPLKTMTRSHRSLYVVVEN